MRSHPDLGAVVSTHPVDNRTRHRTGRRAGAVGLAGVLVLIAEWVDGVPFSAAGTVAPLLAGPTITAAAMLLMRVFRGGDDEGFTVHVNGLSHVNRSGTRSWRWEEIAHIRVRRPRRRDPLTDYFGTDIRGTIRPRTGRSLRFDGMTYDYETLISTVNAHCDPAPPITFRERSHLAAPHRGSPGGDRSAGALCRTVGRR